MLPAIVSRGHISILEYFFHYLETRLIDLITPINPHRGEIDKTPPIFPTLSPLPLSTFIQTRTHFVYVAHHYTIFVYYIDYDDDDDDSRADDTARFKQRIEFPSFVAR